jgi:hypothetical protein
VPRDSKKEMLGFSPGGNVFSMICIPSAAKAGSRLGGFVARLKPCPFKSTAFFRSL